MFICYFIFISLFILERENLSPFCFRASRMTINPATAQRFIRIENNGIGISDLAGFIVILLAIYSFASANTRRSSRFSFLQLTSWNASEAFTRLTTAFVLSMCYILIAFHLFCQIIAEETILVVFFSPSSERDTQLRCFCRFMDNTATEVWDSHSGVDEG